MISGIYAIINLINNKYYVGSAYNIYKRWHSHRSQLNTGGHDSYHLQHAWSKYGIDNFKFIILESCSIEKLEEREQFWVNWTESDNKELGYNLRKITKSNLGFKHSKETRDIISKTNSGLVRSEEFKQKIREANLGKKQSLETAQKRSASMKGRKFTEEHKAKIGAANKGAKARGFFNRLGNQINVD